MTGRARQLRLLTGCLGFGAAPARAGDVTDWQGLLALANDHLLTPALHDRFRRGRDPGVPDDVRPYLELLLQLNLKRNRSLRRQAREAIRAFNAQGIEPLLLKGGIVLFERPSRHLNRGVRVMRDLDFLVPRESLATAVESLRSLDYRILAQYPDGHHALGDFARPGDAGAVDLHSELVDPSYVLPAAEVRSRAVKISSPGITAWMPAPTDRLLHHLLHAQVHYLGDFYRGEIKLNQLYEFSALVQRDGPAIDWAMIERRLGRHGLITPLHSYLYAAQSLFGLAWPLRSPPRLRARAHLARCLVQLHAPGLGSLALPWANLRRAFVAHRMKALYGDGKSLLVARLRHAWHLLAKMSARQVADRLLRSR